VHGAFHGAWCWEPIVPGLERLGAHCTAVELRRGGLAADVAEIQRAVDARYAAGDAVIAVGHSLGCFSIAGLSAGTLAHVVFLAGPVRGPGLPDMRTAVDTAFYDATEFHDGGTMSIDHEKAVALFYADMDEAQARDAASKLVDNTNYGPPEPTDPPLWDVVPSTYLWCDHDRTVKPAYQREVAGRMRYAEGFDTSHSPMLSQPDTVVAALSRVLKRTPART